MSQLSVSGSLGEGNLRNQLRGDKCGGLFLNVRCKRGLRALEGLHFLVQGAESFVVKAGPHFADVLQVMVIICAKEKRPKISTAPFGCGKSPDDEFLTLVYLYFQPAPRSALDIAGGRVLSDDTLEATRNRRFKRSDSVTPKPRRSLHQSGSADGLFQSVAPGLQRFAAQITAVLVEAVEDGVMRLALALLQKLKPGNLVLAKNDDFAIQQQRIGVQLCKVGSNRLVPSRSIDSVARNQSDLLALFVGEYAHPVVFLLEHPASAREGFFDERRQHWGNTKWDLAHRKFTPAGKSETTPNRRPFR